MVDYFLQHYTEMNTRAVKEHKCCECGGFINRGERYWKCTGLADSQWETYKRCEDCMQMCREMEPADPWDAVAFGELHEWADGVSEECYERFKAIQAKRKLKGGGV